MKICLECGQNKDLSEYYYLPSKGTYHAYCTPCQKKKRKERYWNNRKDELEKNAKWQKDNKRGQQKDKIIWHRFGITMDQYNEILKDQGDSCAICGTHKDELNRRMAIDHCHNTMEIRGLLCNRCNSGLGYLRDTLPLVEKAAEYLRAFDNRTETKLKVKENGATRS